MESLMFIPVRPALVSLGLSELVSNSQSPSRLHLGCLLSIQSKTSSLSLINGRTVQGQPGDLWPSNEDFSQVTLSPRITRVAWSNVLPLRQ